MQTKYIEDFSKDTLDYADRVEAFLEQHERIGASVKELIPLLRAIGTVATATATTEDVASRFAPTGKRPVVVDRRTNQGGENAGG